MAALGGVVGASRVSCIPRIPRIRAGVAWVACLAAFCCAESFAQSSLQSGAGQGQPAGLSKSTGAATEQGLCQPKLKVIAARLGIDGAQARAGFANASGLQPEVRARNHALMAVLGEQMPDCQNDPQWLASAGLYLLQGGEHAHAADYLERALMIGAVASPLAGALPGPLSGAGAASIDAGHLSAPSVSAQGVLFEWQLDYALALAGSGQEDSALSLIQDLLRESSMPPHLRSSLTGMLHRLQGGAVATAFGADWRLSAGMRVGHESNLLGAPNLSELGLTVSGVAVTLPLDPSYLSQSGQYTRAEMSALGSGVLPLPAGLPGLGRLGWQAWAQLSERQSAVTPQAGLKQAGVGAELSSGPVWASLSLSKLSSNAGLSYEASAIGVGLSHLYSGSSWMPLNQGACQVRTGAELQNRNYLSSASLSGRYGGLLAQWSCEPQGVALPGADGGASELTGTQGSLRTGSEQRSLAGSWSVSLAIGQDHPVQPPRAGGIQDELALRLIYSLPLRGWGKVQLSGGAAGAGPASGQALSSTGSFFADPTLQLAVDSDYKRDHDPYSALLGGAQRRVSRLAPRVEWSAKPAASSAWRLQLGWQQVRQRSNLALFEMKTDGLYLAFSRLWP